jgi:hypothetical protein
LIILSDNERVWAGELLAKLILDYQDMLMMLDAAVITGESKPDNPNIAEGKRVLGYLEPLFKKIETSEGDLELSTTEAGQLGKLINDVELTVDCVGGEIEDEIEQAEEEGLENEGLSDESANIQGACRHPRHSQAAHQATARRKARAAETVPGLATYWAGLLPITVFMPIQKVPTAEETQAQKPVALVIQQLDPDDPSLPPHRARASVKGKGLSFHMKMLVP